MKWNGSESRRTRFLVVLLTVVSLVVAFFIFKSQSPVVTAVVEPLSIVRGEIATLKWSSQNVKKLYLEETPGTGVRKLDLSGEMEISSVESTIFNFRGVGKNGKIVLEKVALSVIQPLPQIFAKVEPEIKVIRKGDPATLKWEAINATSVNISGIGDVPISGTKVVFPTETTKHIFVATGPGGTTTETVELSVIQPLPQIFVKVEPEIKIVGKGDPATLKWEAINATSVNISGIGYVSISGTKVVSPAVTTEYIFTATGPGGKAETVVEVKVLQVPVFKGKIVESDSAPKLFTYKDDKNREWYFVVFEVIGEAKIRAPFDGKVVMLQSFGPEELGYDQGWSPSARVTVYDNNGITLAEMGFYGYGLTPATDLKHIRGREEGALVKKGRVVAVFRGKLYVYFLRPHFINNEWRWANDYNMFYYYFPSLFDGK